MKIPKKYKIPFKGFLFGFIGTFVATLGLIFQPIEIVADIFMAPMRFLLSPLRSFFAMMNGFLNMLIFGIVTGIIYALIFYIVDLLYGKLKSAK